MRSLPKTRYTSGHFMSFEEYLEVRKFTFFHHYSGEVDNLSRAVVDESNKLGIKVGATSLDLAAGKDLLREEPYRSHKQAAEQGVVDGYHAGFPCNTFTRLRWRKAPNMPPPLRSKKYPYGLPVLSHHHKDECNIGTILMARAIGMVDAVHRADRCAKVPSFATLENPPPSDHEEHISAWHMPEMVELVDRIDDWKCAHFNTCAYESDFPLGTKHYKPQMVGGTLPGICSLNRVCTCGNKTHEPIVGKDKSSKSAAYPWEFCQAYGELAARHFMKHGKDGVLGREIDTSAGPHYLPQGECGRCHERGREPGGAHQDRREIFSSQKRAGAQEEEGGRARRNGGGERLRQLGPFGGRGLEQKQLWRGSVAKAEPASSAAPPKTKEEKPKVDLKPKAEKDREEETEGVHSAGKVAWANTAC